MTHSNRTLHRRPRIERRVLAILRGADLVDGDAEKSNAFRRLRHIAARKDMEILSPQTRYLGDDELTLLAWLAAAQRINAADMLPADRCLFAVIARCARLLEEADLKLYPLTLYRPWLPVAQ